jgi:L-ribulose-5-phosphate 3-epimerase
MKIALFSQSLFALSCLEAIEATRGIGFTAIELACTRPHFDLEMAKAESQRLAEYIRAKGLAVSALSLFNNFTDEEGWEGQVAAAEIYIRLAPMFGTDLLKLTPGTPGSTEATDADWDRLIGALERLVPVAEEVGVRLAVETHMRQLTDTLVGTLRLLERVPTSVVGLTVDFSNLSFAGEEMAEVIPALGDRIYNTHIKNGNVGGDGSWNFQPLDVGLTDYSQVLTLLREIDYGGYLTLECLEPEARTEPVETAGRDLEILRSWLEEMGITTPNTTGKGE